MSTNNDDAQPAGVSNCYVFKSRLQELSQKAGYKTPVYNTIKEGPSHQPYFRSSVIVNDIKYDSLLGFLSRKAAEQSAAEVALIELAKAGATQVCQPVYETGLCKNLLQEYALKRNYATPLYDTKKDDKKGRDALHISSVDIGGIKYIGGAAKTKKLAELKAARTALLAIESTGSESTQTSIGDSVYTVIPAKRKETSSDNISTPEEKQAGLPKKKKMRYRKRGKGLKNMNNVDVNKNEEGVTELNQSAPEQVLVPCDTIVSKDGHADALSIGHSDLGTKPEVIGSFVSSSDINTLMNEVTNVTRDALNELKQMEFSG